MLIWIEPQNDVYFGISLKIQTISGDTIYYISFHCNLIPWYHEEVKNKLAKAECAWILDYPTVDL